MEGWCKSFCSLPRALSLDPTVTVTTADNRGKERVTRTENSTRNSSIGTERMRKALSHFRMLYTCRVSEKIHKQKTQHITRTMTAEWAESKSPSFQLAGNLCEAHSTEEREKTSYTEDSLSGQQNSESSHNQHNKRGSNNTYIMSVQSGFPSFQCDFASRQNLFCLMTFPST